MATHNYKTVFLILILAASSQLFGQNIPIKLQWTENIVVNDEQMSYEVLSFEGADYGGPLQRIPYYKVSLDLPVSEAFTDYELHLDVSESQMLSSRNENLIRETGFSENNFLIESSTNIARGKVRLIIRIFPFRVKGAGVEKLISGTVHYSKSKTQQPAGNRQQLYADNSVLASGNWYRVPIRESGVYCLTYSQLEQMGIANPSQVRVFGNDAGMLSMLNDGLAPDDLQENTILHSGNKIYFYAKGPHGWQYSEEAGRFRHRDHLYSDVVYYYFTSTYNSGFDNRLITASMASGTPDFEISSFPDFKRINRNELNIARTGRVFYGDVFDITLSRNYSFEFPNLITNQPLWVAVSVAGASGTTSYFNVEAGQYTGRISIPPLNKYMNAKTGFLNFETYSAQANGIDINLSYNQLSPSWKGWLNYIEVHARRELRWTGEAMHFRNSDAIGSGKTAKYTVSGVSENLQIWDISHPVLPQKVPAAYASGKFEFQLSSESRKEFIIFDPENCLSLDAGSAEAVENQNLHALGHDIDMVIVSHPLFYSYAQEIEQMREQEGLTVYLTTPEKIYNEFSAGAPDISAIRNFVKMIYDRAPQPEDALRYLLLFGDASYDNKGDFDGNTNYILSYQCGSSVGQTNSYFSDDFFGLLDAGEGDTGNLPTGLLDIGVGRIPASNVGQAADYLRKLKRYANAETFGSWRNRLVFVADDEDSNYHIKDADTLANYIDEHYPWFDIKKIYFDSYRQISSTGGERYPEVTAEINNSVLKGALLVNYTGHGGTRGWAHERVLAISDIESWKNINKLPLFVTATCEFTRFDDYNFLSAGERVFFNPQGGAIAMFTTARLAYIHSNGQLTKAFYKFIFETDDNGKQYRLGDVIRLTKNDRNGNDKDLIFFLLGDPSMKLGYARHEAVTESINEVPIENYADTVKALSKVKFSGRIENVNGNSMNSFNGMIYPVVFDKTQEITTLNNDGIGEYSYLDRSNVLFKGQATVRSGEFEFEFIVPRDIFLNVDTGKVIYYAADNELTAKGYNQSFLVGGISDDFPNDSQGPEIKLYMNDENFVPGGTTDPAPLLFGKLSDESGINTASGAIGHDITAVLDDDIQNTIYLNNDYISDPDTYKSGELKHYLFDLEEGEHKVKLKAWDVYNNSSEEMLDFTVINSDDLLIKHLLNYPNPFSTSTAFYFEHNKAFDRLDVLIQVFTPSGRLVKTIKESTDTEGYRAGPYYWDGTDDFGQRIGRGAYIYRVKVRSSDGSIQEDYQKLLILK